MAEYGLLGRKLGHSFSPQIHRQLGGYAYGLFETEPEQLEDFLAHTKLRGMNVTIPYKKMVLPYLAGISPEAAGIGSVNTLVRLDDGWYGYNTDYCGFCYLVRQSGYDVSGRKGLVLGSGGASLAVTAALKAMGAGSVTVISRGGPDSYDDLERHADVQFLVNTTPVGMYPENGRAAVSLEMFPQCEAVFDIIYNPARTALLMEAEERGLLHAGGLSMLVAQAARSAEIFLEARDPQRAVHIPDERIEAVTAELAAETGNIILIGMPGCGKSCIGKRLAERLDRPFLDLDAELEKRTGRSPEEIILADGEDAFRDLEAGLIADVGRYSGYVLSAGGGPVTREGNYRPLHQNGTIVWLQRDLEKLSSAGRPVSRQEGIASLYARREPLYRSFADVIVLNDGEPGETVDAVIRELGL